MISYSGTTSELLSLLPHISEEIPLIAMTSHAHPSACPLIANRENTLLLPAPIHESEKTSFGIAAPTTSTTVALALGDALALSVADKLHAADGKTSADVFRVNHPGGAIGAASSISKPTPNSGPPLMSDLAVSVADIPIATASPTSSSSATTATTITSSFSITGPHLPVTSLDILRTALRSPGGWVRLSPTHLITPRRIQQDLLPPPHPDSSTPILPTHPSITEKADWISVLGSWRIDEAEQWILRMRREARGRTFLKRGTVLGIVDARNEVSGVVEIEDVVGEEVLMD
jgi:hypothetical protein